MFELSTALNILRKDLLIELRNRYSINVIVAFIVASLLLVLFALRAQELSPTPKSGLIWIIILFGALSSLSRSFLQETDKKTYTLLRVYSSGTSVFVGKLIFNVIFTFFIIVVTFALYIFFVDLIIVSGLAFIFLITLGTLGFASISTMLAAIVAQADRKGAIFSVLSIPLLLPFILILTDLTKAAFIEGFSTETWNNVVSLVGFVGVTTTAGILLFEFIWED